MSDPMSKQEAVQQLSKHLRRPELSDEMFVKLLTVFATLQGWIKKGAR
jgi:hypothetical protein